MHPTVDEQLRGADRLIQKVESNFSLPAEAAQHLTNARRLLARVAKSWSAMMPFHRDDNSAMVALLGEIAPAVPGSQGMIDDAATWPIPVDVIETTERNARLRELLSQVIRSLPATPAGDDARARIGTYLRQRVDTDPT